MVQNFMPAKRSELNRSNEERIKVGDLNGKTLDQDRYVPVFEIQSNRTEVYAPGIGPDNRQTGTGWADMDFSSSGNGSNNAGDNIDGKLRWEMYGDASREDLRRVSDTFRTEDVRSAVSANRTEKRLVPQSAPAAPQDGYVVLGLKVDSGDDGAELEVAGNESDADLGIPYAKMR